MLSIRLHGHVNIRLHGYVHIRLHGHVNTLSWRARHYPGADERVSKVRMSLEDQKHGTWCPSGHCFGAYGYAARVIIISDHPIRRREWSKLRRKRHGLFHATACTDGDSEPQLVAANASLGALLAWHITTRICHFVEDKSLHQAIAASCGRPGLGIMSQSR
jgi:hypothetical protein